MKPAQLIRLFIVLMLAAIPLGNLFEPNVNWNSSPAVYGVPGGVSPNVNWNSSPAVYGVPGGVSPNVNWNSSPVA